MCDCDLCVRNRRVRLEIERLPEDRQAFFDNLFEYMMEVEFDLDVSKAIIDGSWPSADECIANARKRRAEKQSTLL